jgi:hypothetical protein
LVYIIPDNTRIYILFIVFSDIIEIFIESLEVIDIGKELIFLLEEVVI